MLKHFGMFADYNRWANEQLYAAAANLGDADYRKDMGAFFGSLHATLNHLLSADRIWMKRFTGTGTAPTTLNAILHDDLPALTEARRAEDHRIIAWIAGLEADALSGTFTYTPITAPTEITQPLAPALAHVFNHQTHHRGQCHTILTALGQPSLGLDLAYFLRGEGAKWV
ncbi:DinB family protein [Rhizobium sp. LjRoot30]|uniref:DinB family protein n=1 Tax=Rhizobium sp. LjRoot30 TaxID=3342320 RepID=UPI003ECE627A